MIISGLSRLEDFSQTAKMRATRTRIPRISCASLWPKTSGPRRIEPGSSHPAGRMPRRSWVPTFLWHRSTQKHGLHAALGVPSAAYSRQQAQQHITQLYLHPFGLQRAHRRPRRLQGRPPALAKDAASLGDDGNGGEGEGATPAVPPAAARGSLLASPYDKEIFALAIPALFSVLLDPMMGMVDTAIVGRLGTEPLAAVGLSTIIYNFSNFIWNFLLYTTTPRIAAAVSKQDDAAVSSITSQSLWVAGAIGVAMTLLLWNYCPAMFHAMGAKPEVLPHAVLYLRGRCIASPSILFFYVLSGTFRGYKDTVTPLMAGIFSNIVHLGLDVALVFWLGMGVTGAALATSLSHWVTVVVLLGMVVRKGYLRLPDLVRPPSWADVAPMLRSGFFLSTRSILAMAMLLWSTKLIAGFGAVSLAAHEILRQIFVFSNQAYTCLDIATQSLVAFYLGRSDKQRATDVFVRVSQLALLASAVVMAGLLGARGSLPAVFTKDAAVIQLVIKVLPVIAVFMPLDAIASVMDGVLLGSQQAAWMSKTMVATSAVCACALLGAQAMGLGILSIWCVIKFLTLGRCIGNAWRLWSKDSPLVEMRSSAAARGAAATS